MTAKTYNRIAKDKKPIGHVFTRSGPPPLEKDYALVETLLERRRPKDKLSRNEAVNMRNDRNFSMMGIDAYDHGYVHEVEPVGEVTEHDVEWIGALQRRYPKSGVNLPDKYPKLSDDEIVDRYWNGTKSASPSMEFHAKEAKVVAVDDELSPVRPPSGMAKALDEVRAYDPNKKDPAT